MVRVRGHLHEHRLVGSCKQLQAFDWRRVDLGWPRVPVNSYKCLTGEGLTRAGPRFM